MKSHQEKLIAKIRAQKNRKGARVRLSVKDRFMCQQFDEIVHLIARLMIKIDRLETKTRTLERKMIDQEGG